MKLTNISVGIEISINPSLMVSSVLNILMESGEDPLLLEGRIKAGLLTASASVYEAKFLPFPKKHAMLTNVSSAPRSRLG